MTQYTPSPADIDKLAAAAVEAGPDAQHDAVQWGALWRVVLSQKRWFFVKDDSGQVRPGLVQVNGAPAVPVFTDIDRAIAFATDLGRDANAVFTSPPRDIVSAAPQLEAGGVELFAFNPGSTLFAAKPAFVKSMLDELDEYVAASTPPPLGQGDPEAVTIIDHLAASAATAAQENSDEKARDAAQAALWQAVFALDHLFTLPRGESFAPAALHHETGPAILVFTSAERAVTYAAELESEQEPESSGSVVALPTKNVVPYLEQFIATGATLVQVDPGQTGFVLAPQELREMYIRVTGQQPGPLG